MSERRVVILLAVIALALTDATTVNAAGDLSARVLVTAVRFRESRASSARAITAIRLCRTELRPNRTTGPTMRPRPVSSFQPLRDRRPARRPPHLSMPKGQFRPKRDYPIVKTVGVVPIAARAPAPQQEPPGTTRRRRGHTPETIAVGMPAAPPRDPSRRTSPSPMRGAVLRRSAPRAPRRIQLKSL